MKINAKNEQKITEALNSAQVRARTRLATYHDVEEALDNIEDNLSSVMAKKDWTGVRVFVDPFAENFANSYKGIPESTQFILERTSSGWFMTAVKRNYCLQRATKYEFLNIEKFVEAIIHFKKKPF